MNSNRMSWKHLLGPIAGALTVALVATADAGNGTGGALDRPAPPAGANRVETFKPKLDGDDAKDRVLVYNLPTDGSPATYFESWTRKQGKWELRQQKLVNAIPSLDPSAGLVEAWVSDLNKDGRKEIAVRDFFTPAYGEVLSILRQKSGNSLKFERLQTVGGDRAVVKKQKRGNLAVLSIYRKDIHSPDNREHHEKWKWSQDKDQWRCKKDCAPLP